MKKVDVGIWGLVVQTVNSTNKETGNEEFRKVIRTVHNVYIGTGEMIGEQYFELLQESTGTLRFLSYIQDIISMIEDGGVSKIYALSDIKVREDATFNKDYLQGKYGAIPIM